jgi:hypothetical protein
VDAEQARVVGKLVPALQGQLGDPVEPALRGERTAGPGERGLDLDEHVEQLGPLEHVVAARRRSVARHHVALGVSPCHDDAPSTRGHGAAVQAVR